MITAVRIQNLRSLKDTGFIDLKKINVLIGVNDAGKSSFLRSFALLAQSVNKKLREPISWFDDSMVDFGDYRTAKYSGATEDERIRFSFRIVSPFSSRRRVIQFGRDYTPLRGEYIVEVAYDYDDRKGTYVSEIVVNHEGVVCRFDFDGPSGKLHAYVDDIEVLTEKEYDIEFEWLSESKFFPLFFTTEKHNDILYHVRAQRTSYRAAIEKLHQIAGPRLKHTNRLEPYLENNDMNKGAVLKTLRRHIIAGVANAASSWSVDTPAFLSVYRFIFLDYILRINENLEYELINFFHSLGYIAPLRAEAVRYYRNMGLRTDDIDAFGNNLTEFVASLSQANRKSLNAFLKETIGITVSPTNSRGHVSIQIEENGRSHNVVDKGFGYSQILPILVKLWLTRLNGKSRSYHEIPSLQQLTAMEQPALHLHPAMQAHLTDAFVKAVDAVAENSICQLMIETHSPVIINRLGRRVREGWISPDDINVLVFEKKRDDDFATIDQIAYDASGKIKNWPYGFFDPED